MQEVKAPEVTTDPATAANDAGKPSEETQIPDQPDTAMSEATKALAQVRDTLTNSLTEKTTELDAVKKSLDETKEQVTAEQAKHAEVAKTLEDTKQSLENTQAELEETKTQLETAKQSIVAKDNRKARVYSSFGALQWEEPETKPEAKKSVRDAWMADLGLAVEKNAQEAH